MPNSPKPRLTLLAACALLAAPLHASQWLTLTSPAPNATLPPLAQSVTFAYTINVHGFRQHTHSTDPIGTWITVCTGACTTSADMITSWELKPAEQTSTTLAISKIKQHLMDHHLPIDTQIRWNLMFHVAGIFYDPSERQTNSTFFLGHVEAAGGAKPEAKPTAAPTPKPIH